MELRYTRNIKLAAFLRMKGHHPDGVRKISKGKAEYGYCEQKLPIEKWDALKVEFDLSPFITYAHCLDAIVDLAY